MAFDLEEVQGGVSFGDSGVVGALTPFQRLEAQEAGLGPFEQIELAKELDHLSVQRRRGGGVDVFNNLLGEQQVTSEYLETPSVLSIRRGLTVLAATDKFILGSFNESDQEKMSFIFTFGDPVLFGGMGRRPRIFTYSGFLKDSLLGGKGISGWRKMYEKYLRGTKCRSLGAVADLKFRDQWRVGYLVASNMSYEEQRTRVASFSFSMFIIHAE
jgi:hypothetical protein